LGLISGVLNIVLWYDDSGTYIKRESLNRALSHVAITGDFFENLGDILLFATFIELGSGFLLCLNSGGPLRIRKNTRTTVLLWGLLLLILSLSLFAFNQSITARFYSSLGTGSNEYAESAAATRDRITLYRLAGAVYFLLWITSIPVLVYASYVVHKTKNHPTLRSVSCSLSPPPPYRPSNTAFATTCRQLTTP
jgi:hypothetical protein